MCWRTNESVVLKKAEKDIKTFKILYARKKKFLFYTYGIDIISYFMKFPYELNKQYSIMNHLVPFRSGSEYIICDGFHSYSSKYCKVKLSNNDLYDIKVRFESPDENFLILDYSSGIIRKRYKTVIAHAIIPKGAKYAFNEEGECVSDKIIITDIEEIG